MRRDPVVRHSDTNYPNHNDGNNYIYKVSAGEEYGAECSVSVIRGTGIILEADININADVKWANGAYNNHVDVWSAFMHEAGHVAGLGHSSVQNAVMYYRLDTNTIKRELDVDDHAGVRAIYWD